jgi:flagellar hook-associated protein 2
VEAAITAFVTAYNGLQTTAGQLTKYDAETHSGAPLVGDSTLRTVQTRIRAALNTPQAGELKVLSRIGVSFQKDGTLAFDATKLKTALAADPGAVTELFSGDGTPTGTGGIGKQMSTLLDGFTSKTGMISNATSGIQTTLKSLDHQFTATQDRVDATVARYKAQFTALDMMVSRMQNTGNYLTQQFANMSSSNK